MTTENNVTVFKSASRRERFAYACLVIFAGLGIYGIYKNVNLAALAGYIAAFSPFAFSYISNETKRPHGTPPK